MSAYHQNADPFQEERFSARPLPEHEFARRLSEGDFRGVVATRDPQFGQLRDRELSQCRFEGARVKGCLIQGALLRGADCRDANFSGSTFRQTDFRDADFTGSDLEGASFVNADLRGADLRNTALAGARFYSARYGARIEGARFLREDVEREGVLEQERRYLLDPAQGAIIL